MAAAPSQEIRSTGFCGQYARRARFEVKFVGERRIPTA